MPTPAESSPPVTESGRQLFLGTNSPTWDFYRELSFLLFSLYLWVKLIFHTVSYYDHNAFCVVLGFIFAQLLADWISGMFHWACDTWGKFETPIIGPLIQSFRMHHVDPLDITKHGFFEVNANLYPMPFFIAVGLWITPNSSLEQIYVWTIIFGVILSIFTDEIHKWAHMIHSKPHPIVQFLQKSRLILSPEEHHRHHQN